MGQTNARSVSILALLVVTQGCAVNSLRVSEDVRSSLGTVGVVAVVFPAPVSAEPPPLVTEPARAEIQSPPTSADTAVRFLGELALAPVKGVVQGLAIAFFPFALPVLLLDSAPKSEPSLSLREPQAVVDRVLGDRVPVEDLRRRLIALAAAKGEEVANVGADGAARLTEEVPDYSALVTAGVNTVLEIGMLSVSLNEGSSTAGTKSLSLKSYSLLVAVRPRRIRVAAGKVLWQRESIAYRSSGHRVADWEADEGALLRAAYARALDDLSQDVYSHVIARP
jgi:hypothetical protein